MSLGLEWVERHDDALFLRIDVDLYSEEAVLRSCYVFTDRCYIFVERDGKTHLSVRFKKRQHAADLERVIGEFCNELLNQRLRLRLSADTQSIREQIVRRAFADTDFDA